MARDLSNPSSIMSCLRAARENARAVRSSTNSELWESLNTTWLDAQRLLADGVLERDPYEFLEWVKFRSNLSRGVKLGTLVKDDAFWFMRLGTFIERADNTARILDVKFEMLEQRAERRRSRSITTTGRRCCVRCRGSRCTARCIAMSLRRRASRGC